MPQVDPFDKAEPLEMLQLAISFAASAHINQLDKGKKPYIFHPLRVALKLINEPISVQIVALLHDVVEDCGVHLDGVEDVFGKEVRDAVDSVSRRVYPDGSKELYRDFILRSKSNEIGRKVKLADLEDNISVDRLGALPVDEAISMRKKYDKAIAVLNEV